MIMPFHGVAIWQVLANDNQRRKAMTSISKRLDDDVRIWIEQETVHLKVIDSYGDPVEFNAEECRVLATRLMELAKQIE